MRDRSNNTLVLTHEPFVGYMPDDVRCALTGNAEEKELATAMAHVSNKVGSLFHNLGESDDPWAHYAFEKWRGLECELIDRILLILQEERESTAVQYGLQRSGWYYAILPFMKRNGYRNGSGWWIEEVPK